MQLLQHKKLSASGVAYTGGCALASMFIGMDGVNDPEITVYDGIDATGSEVVPTATYDASALGLNGFHGGLLGYDCKAGIYVEITCAGTVEVVVGYKSI